MGIYADDLRELIIRPTLLSLDEWSPDTENLLLGTAAQESQLGFKMQSQRETGMGLYRISSSTHIQVWDQYLVTNPDLASRVRGLASQQQFLKSPHTELITNLSYATGIAWMIYKRHRQLLTSNASLHELAQCWLHCYSNRDDQNVQTLFKREEAQLDKFVQNFKKLVLREKKEMAA